MSLRFTSLAGLDLRYRNSPITTQVTNTRTPRHNPTIKLVLELGTLFPVMAKKKKHNIKSLLCSTFSLTFRGVARIFQRGSHHPGIADYIWFIPLLSLVYQRAQSYYRGMKAILAKYKSRWQKYFTKKQILKKWAFQQWLLRPRYCHGVLPPEYCRLFAQKKA